MDSPPPASPSPSTPTSGDEDFGTGATQDFSLSNASPVPKRRAVASSSTSGPSRQRTRGSTSDAKSNQPKEELVDVQYMNELKQSMLGLDGFTGNAAE